jgi:hypothetical protein
MGLVAPGILAPAEIAGVLWVRGLSLHEYLTSFVTTPGVISAVMFLRFAAMPSLVTLLTRGRGGAISRASWSTPEASGTASRLRTAVVVG